jgi:UDP-N-acetylmuramoyl-tripeptide--D-alanyl-D-alanine ligase
LIKIGITGSFGKTSCKNILAEILSTQYRVTVSPNSFNTPMGFARTVNGYLTDGTQILIMEMGARKRGDIAEMCKLLKPDYGIITAIGPQHLETFGDIETVRATKMELCDFVPKENMVKIDDLPPISAEFETKLLGRHNQINIALCVQMAKKFGITDENIKNAVKYLRTIPHRLEPIESGNGVKVLDDSYNSNPIGAEIALEVMANSGGAKVVQTCGFAEQGEAAHELNFKFGGQIARAADFVIIMGELNRAALNGGLISAGFPPEKIFFAPNIEAAKTIYSRILHSGDTLLIENDLPENY